MYKLVFFVPESHLDSVKAAVFAAGAGRIGDYDQCSWQVLGQGQFRPLVNSAPFIGTLNQLETLPEYRVEMVCADEYIRTAIAALRTAHPYEEPAFDVWQLTDPELLP
ncbi:MAG: YqfO family protein [Cellvibrio sp.]|uniref:NGG1p interacting factor NIF3 n=1 Tax=Cellvibrio sp. TaxID=1965322 RepID=UPI0031A9CC3C